MSESIHLALVTAGAGLAGAIVGGLSSLAATYFGPKWERERQDDVEFLERRRLAVIGWIRAGQLLAPAVVHKRDTRQELAAAFNLAVSELTSLLTSEETAVDNFIHGVSGYSGGFKADEGARALVISNAGRLLIAWHRGSIQASSLRPFKLVHSDGISKSTVVFVDTWTSPVEGEVTDRASNGGT